MNCLPKTTDSSLVHDPVLQKQTLAGSLCRIPTQSSFVENFQEGLQVHLKRTPLQMFPKVTGKFPKNIGAAHKNSNILYKMFYADAETSKWLFCSFTLIKSCYSKRCTAARSPLGPHTFLHKINTSRVKIRPVFKKFMILIS